MPVQRVMSIEMAQRLAKIVRRQQIRPQDLTEDAPQRQYAAVVVPAKRFYFPPYSFAANYYWPEGAAKAAPADKAESQKK